MKKVNQNSKVVKPATSNVGESIVAILRQDVNATEILESVFEAQQRAEKKQQRFLRENAALKLINKRGAGMIGDNNKIVNLVEGYQYVGGVPTVSVTYGSHGRPVKIFFTRVIEPKTIHQIFDCYLTFPKSNFKDWTFFANLTGLETYQKCKFNIDTFQIEKVRQNTFVIAK